LKVEMRARVNHFLNFKKRDNVDKNVVDVVCLLGSSVRKLKRRFYLFLDLGGGKIMKRIERKGFPRW